MINDDRDPACVRGIIFSPDECGAQSYPKQAINLLIPSLPAMPTDVAGRTIGERAVQSCSRCRLWRSTSRAEAAR